MKEDYLKRLIVMIWWECGYLTKAFLSRRFSLHESTPNSSHVDISNIGMDSHEVTERLAGNGILVRDCAMFQGLDGRYVRVAVRTKGGEPEVDSGG